MSDRPKIKTQLDAVVYFMCKMDAEMISTLLDDQRTYQDFVKHQFVRKLGDLFYEFSERGDFRLIAERGQCSGCSYGEAGFTFVGNRSRSYIDIIFVCDEYGQVLDMFECSEFCTRNSGIRKKQRLYLDQYVEYDVDEEDDHYDENDDQYYDDDLPF